MKNMTRKLTVLVMAVLLLAATLTPAKAANFDTPQENITAQDSTLFLDNNMNDIFDDLKNQFEDQQNDYEDIKNQVKERREAIKDRQAMMEKVFIVIAVIAVGLLIAEITYIFIAAPKCGMSRFWALVPLFSNFFGLLVFIVVRSNQKNTSVTNTISCPTCNSVHPSNVTVCSVCGTKLQ